MKLILDHTQRLNLHALLGAQRVDVGAIRAIWAIQDRITLSSDEEKAIELKRETIGGQYHVVWNPTLSIPATPFEFDEAEAARIKAAIQSCDLYRATADRSWLEPLMKSLFSNGLH